MSAHMVKVIIVMALTLLTNLNVMRSEGETGSSETEREESCLCPEQLPWHNYPFTESNSQQICGKELMYLVPNTTCVRDAVYDCKINETKAEFKKECKMRYVRSPVYCAPTVLEECAQGKPVKKAENYMSCLRKRSCDVPHRTLTKLKITYGKDAKKVCGDIPDCAASN